MTERSGVEIDYCPTCRGVWLDRGELDKLISHGSTQRTSPPIASNERGDRLSNDHRHDDDDDDDGDDRRSIEYDRQQPRRNRKGWLGDLFDF